MRAWVMVLLLAGCAGPSDPAVGDTSHADASSSHAGTSHAPNGTTHDANVTASNDTEPPRLVELYNDTVTVPANTCNPAMQQEDVMLQVELSNASVLAARFERIQEPHVVYATNIRAYAPGNDEVGRPDQQSAWSGGGTMSFDFEQPAKGTWTFRLLHCDVPQGQHVIDARVTSRS